MELTPFTFPVVNRLLRRSAIDGLPKAGHIFYVIRYATGIVKVGYTSQPRRRMRHYVTAASQVGLGVDALWVSEEHPAARENEGRLIAFCAGQSKRVTGSVVGEFFSNVDLEELLTYARKLPRQCHGAGNKVTAHMDPCDACDRVHDRPLTAFAVMHRLANRELRVVDEEGRDVTEMWAGPAVPRAPHSWGPVNREAAR